MRARQKIVTVVIVVALLLVTTGAAVAQEEQPASGDTIRLTWAALAGLVSVVLTVGLGGGLGGALLFVRAVNQNEPLKLAIEKLYLSAAPETQRLIRGSIPLGHELFDLADDLTDGELAASPDDPSG